MKPGFERLSRWTCRFAKAFEVSYWLVAFLTFFFAVAMIWLDASDFLDVVQQLLPGANPPAPVAVLILYILLVFCFFTAVLTAKMWQSIRKAFEISEGRTPASIGPTPFQPENVRLLKKIALYSVIIQLANAAYFLFRVIVPRVAGNGTEPLYTNITGILSCLMGLVFGLIIFCLAQFFAYGIQLQLDSDGLV